MHRANERSGFPTVITIFSAPNYCDAYNNKAAVLQFENNTLNILQFNYTPHPYHLPNFMDVFQWSVPFVAEKVTEMLCVILQPSLDNDEEDDGAVENLPAVVESTYRNSLSHEQNMAVEIAARIQQKLDADGGEEKKAGMAKTKKERLKKKIRTVAKMQRMFKTMRQQNEAVLKLGGIGPGGGRGGLLVDGAKDASESDLFASAMKLDSQNERMPEKPVPEKTPPETPATKDTKPEKPDKEAKGDKAEKGDTG
jgi:serine/threonine-protein phosphatase 2B catalytic subunit